MVASSVLNSRIDTRWARLDGPARLAGIDLARGLAVVGMLAAHLLVIRPLAADDPSTWVDVVNGRSSILFATLAGVSIALVTGGRRPLRGEARARASGRIAVRAGLLWLIGLALVMTGVPVFVILPAYAILFLLSLPFLGLRPPVLFAIAGVLALVMPFVQVGLDDWAGWNEPLGEIASVAIGWAYPFPTWIAFLLTGLALGRCDLRSTRVQAAMTVAGGAVAAAVYSVAATSGSDPRSERLDYLPAVWTARAHSTGLLEVIGSGAFAVAVIGLCLLACRTPLRWIAVPLRAVGAMPLSAYVAQLVIWAAVALSVLGTTSALADFRALEPFWPITLWIVAGSLVWALLIGRGPLESLVDAIARWVVRDPSRSRADDR